MGWWVGAQLLGCLVGLIGLICLASACRVDLYSSARSCGSLGASFGGSKAEMSGNE